MFDYVGPSRVTIPNKTTSRYIKPIMDQTNNSEIEYRYRNFYLNMFDYVEASRVTLPNKTTFRYIKPIMDQTNNPETETIAIYRHRNFCWNIFDYVGSSRVTIPNKTTSRYIKPIMDETNNPETEYRYRNFCWNMFDYVGPSRNTIPNKLLLGTSNQLWMKQTIQKLNIATEIFDRSFLFIFLIIVNSSFYASNSFSFKVQSTPTNSDHYITVRVSCL